MHFLSAGIRILFLVAGSCFTALLGAAQSGYLFNTKKLTVKDGLAHQEVYDVYQDSRGFMWMATRSGLSRYDGYKFTNFTKEQNGLTNNTLHAVAEDDAGNLWLFSQTGIVKHSSLQSIDLLDIKNGKIRAFASAFPACPFTVKEITHFFTGNNKELFFLTKAACWKYMASTGFRPVRLPPSFIPEASAEDGLFWGYVHHRFVKAGEGKVATELFANESLEGFELASAQPHLLHLFNQQKKQLHIATDSALLRPELLKKLSSGYFQFIRYNDNKKIAWAANDESIQVFDETGTSLFSLYRKTEEAFDRIIRNICLDKRGVAWVATESGVFMIEAKKEKFERYLYTEQSDKKDKGFIQCRGIFQKGAHLYVGTYKGTFRIDLTSQRTTLIDRLTENGEDFGNRFTFAHDGDTRFFVGAKRPVIADAATGQELSFVKGVKRSAWSYYMDAKKRLYIGTDNGLLLFDRDKGDTVTAFMGYNQYKELADHFVPGIIKDRSNVTWVVSSNGLYVLDEQHGITEHYGSSEKGNRQLLTDNLHHLYQDADGIYWICTGNAGLIKWNRSTGEQKQYSKATGLSSNCLYALYEDKMGYLWISSDYGLIRFDKKRELVGVYTPEDGISHYEFNRISHFQATDGRIYFGGLNGITAFYPEDVYDSADAGNNTVMIAGFQQYIGAKGNLVDLTAELLTTNRILLNPADRFFSLAFAVPDFMNTAKVIYHYMIEGVDKDWIKTSNNEVRFGRLPYGDYMLRVKAQMPNGHLTKEVNIRVQVERPWFLKWWFYVLAALLVALGVRFFYQWRIRQLQVRKKELEAIVEERTAELQADKTIIEQQAAELKQLDEMKSNFFVNVAHELRTPLTLLAGPVKQLVRQTDATDQRYHYLQLMQQNVQQLQHKVNEILDFSKLEAGKLEVRLEPMLVKGFSQLLLAPFHHAAGQKQVALSFDCPLPDNASYLQDKEKLANILNNLLSNALKFTPAGGTIQLNVAPDGEGLRFTVADTGPGIAAADRPHIFKRYYQAKHSASGGTGIGLAFSKELTQLLQGHISVESRPGQGARFTVWLPSQVAVNQATVATATMAMATAGTEADKAAEPLPVGWQKDSTILLVEDNADLQQFITLELQPYYTVLTAGNGQEALTLLHDRKAAGQPPVQLIISDIMMPVMDGFALLEQLRAHPDWQSIPVVMLTARSGIADKLTAFRIGVDDYMVKPFDTQELMARVNNLLQRQYARRHWADAPEAATPMEEPAPTENRPEWLLQLQDIVQAKLDSQALFTIEDIAAALYISTRQLQRNVKSETGLTLNNYIKEIRLHRALQLLEKQQYATVAEYSYAVGFNDPHYFSTLFVERYGKKPAEYLG
jgi:signal transduction histidine kinase/DNA-binding response OmpR family regulator/ligand-binding sensor domain-containing protein